MVVTTVRAGRGKAGAATGQGLGIGAVGALGILGSVSRVSMMKCTVGAGGVFLGTSGRSMSKPIPVGALGIAVSLLGFLDFEPL